MMHVTPFRYRIILSFNLAQRDIVAGRTFPKETRTQFDLVDFSDLDCLPAWLSERILS